MMEREFITQKIKEYQIQEFVDKTLGNVGHSHTVMKKTPLGEKVIVFASRPGLVVGRRGANIKDLTKALKKEFKLENPQIEISEVENVFLDANIVAEKIVSSLERFGTARFKGVGHKTMERVMDSGARGVEILISGKVPGARARSWRFYQGYVKKCGDAALENVRKSIKCAHLKPGSVGVQVSIMPPNIRLPDDISLRVAEPEIKKEEKLESKSQNAEIKTNVKSKNVESSESKEKINDSPDSPKTKKNTSSEANKSEEKTPVEATNEN